jgi:hypothetical protein
LPADSPGEGARSRRRRGRSFRALPRSGGVAPIKTMAKEKTPERLDWILPSSGCYESPPISRAISRSNRAALLPSRLPDTLKQSKPCATRLLGKEVHTTTTGQVCKSGVSKAAVLASQTGRPIDRLSFYFNKYSVPPGGRRSGETKNHPSSGKKKPNMLQLPPRPRDPYISPV